MSESIEDKMSRLQMMADGDDTWDLSTNDCDAIKYALNTISNQKKLIESSAFIIEKYRDTAREAVLEVTAHFRKLIEQIEAEVKK